MRLRLVPKADLTQDQLDYIEQLISMPAHGNDAGPPRVWRDWTNGMFAVTDYDDSTPIGLVEASGTPPSPGWWIDSRLRGQRYGSALVDALADHLIKQGIYSVGHMLVQGNDCQASQKLVLRLERRLGEYRR